METETYECECCDRTLNPSTMVWLELDSNTGLYRKPGECKGLSQGEFTFGKACAAKKLRLSR